MGPLKSLFSAHPRRWREFRYVYPVISRRSRGLSIGINLNPDAACNFDCVYCCADRTTRRRVPPVDLAVLEAELRHMVDVKRLFQMALKVWLAALGVAAVLGVIVWRWGGGDAVRAGMHWGSTATLIAIGVIVVGLVAAFGILFVGFHRIFFQGDTWLFLYTDTLIRLFPVRFWQQAFLTLAGLSLAQAGLLFAISKAR